MSDSVRPHRRQPIRLPRPWDYQARTLEWVAISFSSAWKWKVKVKSLSRVQLLVTPWTAAYQAPLSMGLSRQEYWSGMPLPSPKVTTQWEYIYKEYVLTEMYNHHHGLILELFLHIKKKCPSPVISINIPSSRQLLIYFWSLWICPFWLCFTSILTNYVFFLSGIFHWICFWDWSLLLHVPVFLKFLHFGEQYFIIWIFLCL